MENFATRLRNLRLSRGMTQDDLALELGVSRSTIAGYEAPSKEREPAFDVASRLANHFGVTTDYLLGRTNDPHLYDLKVDDKTDITDTAVIEKHNSEGEVVETRVAGVPLIAEIGRLIRLARRKAKLSQAELAAAVGVDKNVVVLWESGRTAPSESELKRAANCLGTTPEALAPQGLPPPINPEEALKGVELWLRTDSALSEQDIKEIISFVEFMRRKKEQGKK